MPKLPRAAGVAAAAAGLLELDALSCMLLVLQVTKHTDHWPSKHLLQDQQITLRCSGCCIQGKTWPGYPWILSQAKAHHRNIIPDMTGVKYGCSNLAAKSNTAWTCGLARHLSFRLSRYHPPRGKELFDKSLGELQLFSAWTEIHGQSNQ